ncbi:MAG: DUF5688 family protein [Lachnospiraceae bacterium]|nr:DUF5688 family protein [Lachnospiraceae bacterium]
MNKREFTEQIKQTLMEKLGDDVLLEDTKVLKNNGICYEGITIRKKEERISPNIYLDALYERYRLGEPLTKLSDEICSFLEQETFRAGFVADDFIDFEKMKDRIVFKLVNLEKNEKLLEDVPYDRFMDLAKVYYYLVPENEEGLVASVLIHQSHVKIWKTDPEVIRELAAVNTPRLLPPEIIGMKELIEDMAKRLQLPGIDGDSIPMYVLSNERRMNGAAAMAYPGVIREFALRMESDLYVIPSSIHELILVPDNGMMQGMNDFVREVNRTELDPKDVLADHVYYFDRREDQLLAIL